jgi:small subunit ribosomal protein S4
VKRTYGLRERQFRRFYRLAQRTEDLTGPALLKLLERRLDNVIYRMGWARTRSQARHFASHGHILVDGHRVDIPSYLVKPNQMVTIQRTVQRIPEIHDLVENPSAIPDWLLRTGPTGRVLRTPQRNEIPESIDEQLVVEFYSR